VGRFVISARSQTAFYSARVLATIACHSAVKLGDKLHPLIGEHEGHVLTVGLAPLERSYAHLRRGLAYDAVAFTIPVGELELYLGESIGMSSTVSSTGPGKRVSTIQPCTSYWLHRIEDAASEDFR
jgi:hypothetical protein